MKPEVSKFEASLGGKTLVFETGRLAGQAGGAVTLRLGETMVFSAATMNDQPRMGIDFFPLTVDYEERMYAGGKIPGSFFRREGRPSEDAILTSRLTDRSIRPLFNKDLRNDVQVINYSFSVDGINPVDILIVTAASAALMISDIPWNGPIAAVRVGRIDGQLVVNPTFEELASSDLDLRMAGSRDAILMVECGASEVSEDQVTSALEFGHQALQGLIDVQLQMAEEVGKAKRAYTSFAIDPDLKHKVLDAVSGSLNQVFDRPYLKSEHDESLNALRTAQKVGS